MTGKWRVYNAHPMGYTHEEMFKGEKIVIKAGEFVLMDYEDAVQFRGQYFPMITNPQGVQDPKSYKVIKIEAGPEAKEEEKTESKVYVCHVDGKEFTDKKLLEEYMKANFSHLLVKDESLDDEIKKRNKQGR